MADDYTDFIKEFCDTQADDYQVICRFGSSDIEIRGGSMPADEWDDVATELIELLYQSYDRRYHVWCSSKTGFTIVED